MKVAEVAVVLSCQMTGAPPLSETKMVKSWMPEPVSLPVHCTWKPAGHGVPVIGRTLLVGKLLSIVLSHSLVSIGALASKVIRDLLRISVPVVKLGFGLTEKLTVPSPCGAVAFGGRNPAS